ncbi:MAG: SDR family NAD(P)-dependent oxidoreductase [Burkholderiaceae bacterium]|nr:SDR family NAD(P)-dependent oxidoreductase [Microbacteriaceae bacterium]
MTDMTGRTVVITGASSGIGRQAAIALAGRGAHIAVVGRNRDRTIAVAREVGGRAFYADFDHLDEVRSLASDLARAYDRIDVLANNAGGLVPKRAITADGHERTFQSNHLAPFLLTNLLLPHLAGGRVVSTASVANRWARLNLDDLDWRRRPWFGGWGAYGTSKLETILFIEELTRRTGITAYSFHPGLVATGFGTGSPIMAVLSFTGRTGITADAGAVPLIELCSSPDPGAPSGTYFDGLTPHGSAHRSAGDATLAAALWESSAKRVGLVPVA